MKVAVDLHIHSALSPCASNEMTPNNIVNMSKLKGLDIIALTDHNSVENCQALSKCALSAGILFVPGMELQTIEEIHLICLFPNVHQALRMQQIVYASMSEMKNNVEIFGEQLILNEFDEVEGITDKLLIAASGLSIDDACKYVRKFKGVIIPAHIDRQEYSLLSNFGMVPLELGFSYLEISKKCDYTLFITENVELKRFKFLKSSDAHYLEDILEREIYIEIEELNIESLITALSSNDTIS